MSLTRSAALAAASALLLGGCAGTVRAAWWLAGAPVQDLGDPVLRQGPAALATLPLQTAVGGLCGLALLACVTWMVATTVLTLTSHLAEVLRPRTAVAAVLGRTAERSCPRLVRAAVTAVLGTALGAGVAGPALAGPLAEPLAGPLGGTGSGRSVPRVAGLALPDRTTGGLPASGAPAARGADPRDRVVVVQPGDSLWSIATGLLPASASDAATTTAWHRLHSANATRLGGDPDLILPGTRLVVPALSVTHRKDRS